MIPNVVGCKDGGLLRSGVTPAGGFPAGTSAGFTPGGSSAIVTRSENVFGADDVKCAVKLSQTAIHKRDTTNVE